MTSSSKSIIRSMHDASALLAKHKSKPINDVVTVVDTKIKPGTEVNADNIAS